MTDFGTQTDFEPQASHSVPAPQTTELKETTKPTVSKVSKVNFPSFESDVNLAQRKASSRPSVRNTAGVTPLDAASQTQISTDLPSPARQKRARIATKLEREDTASVELAAKETTERVCQISSHEGSNAERVVCRLLPGEAENLRGGDVGNSSKLPRKLKKEVRQLWFNMRLLHLYRQSHLYLLRRNLSHRLPRNPLSSL